jgi:MraZ protein
VKCGEVSPFVGGFSVTFLISSRRAAARLTSLIGTYYHVIDAKGRMNFPTKLRELLGSSFYVTKGLDAHCLAVYPAEEWERLSQKVAAIPESKGAQLKRWLFSGACEMVPDQQGRILIPQDLRQFAGLEKDVVVIGANNKAEIWNRASWETANAAVDLDEMMSILDTLGF